MSKILNARQPVVPTQSANGEPAGGELLAGLYVKVDKNEDGRVLGYCTLLFADYAGLEAEWVAQTVTTVLEAAVEAVYNDIDFPTDQMVTAQRTVFDEILVPVA